MHAFWQRPSDTEACPRWTCCSGAAQEQPQQVCVQSHGLPVLGSSQVKVMLSSLSSGRWKACLMASVNCLYPAGPGFTSKLYVLPARH